MPYVRGHFRQGPWFRSHWVRSHYRRPPGSNALMIIVAAVGIIVLLYLLAQVL